MTDEDLDRLAGLLRENRWGPHRTTLCCAQDVADAMAQAWTRQDDPEQMWTAVLWDGSLIVLMGTDVYVAKDYEPGRWVMTRHDACTVTGMDGTDYAGIVNHENCTVLGES